MSSAQNVQSSVVPIVAGVIGVVGGTVVLLAIAMIATYCKQRRNTADNGRPVLPTPDVDTPSTGYEIPVKTNHHPVNIVENGPTMATSRQYGELNMDAYMLRQWMADQKLDNRTLEKLHQHGISTIQDVYNLSHSDMNEIGLNVGERNRIKKGIYIDEEMLIY